MKHFEDERVEHIPSGELGRIVEASQAGVYFLSDKEQVRAKAGLEGEIIWIDNPNVLRIINDK